MRAGIRRLLEDGGVEVVAEAESGETFTEACCEHVPDVGITDIHVSGIGGMEAIRRTLARQRNARILVLGAHGDALFPVRVIKAGARGYLTKGSTPKVFLRAVFAVFHGETFLDPEISQRIVLNGIVGKDPLQDLTDREFEIFRLLTSGYTVAEIAKMLFLSPKTVGTHQTRIFSKAGVKNMAMLTRLAIRKGVIDP